MLDCVNYEVIGATRYREELDVGFYGICSIKNNKDTNLVVEFKVILSEIGEETELADNLKNLKSASYSQLYEKFMTPNSPWKCE